MPRLYEGMEIPCFTQLHEKIHGTTGLMVLSGAVFTDITGLFRKFEKTLREINVSLLVLTDTHSNEDLPEIITDAGKQIISEILDDIHQTAFFLLDEKGKILLAEYPDAVSELYDSERIRDMVQEAVHPEISEELLENILDAYPYEIVYVDRHHVVRYMNATAKQRYGERVQIGNSLFNCHNERSREKILSFLKRADEGENEMFETYNQKTGEREFFVPVRNRNGKVIGYFERHEAPWNKENASHVPGAYWKNRI